MEHQADNIFRLQVSQFTVDENAVTGNINRVAKVFGGFSVYGYPALPYGISQAAARADTGFGKRLEQGLGGHISIVWDCVFF
jgi:hypothetical protein